MHNSHVTLHRASAADAQQLAVMVGELLHEIMNKTGIAAFNFDAALTTPPLPQFDQTIAFYQREGFAITGGRKLKVLL